MSKKCFECIDKYTNPDCQQCNRIKDYNKRARKELSIFLNYILYGSIIIAIFNTANFILIKAYPNTEFGLAFAFWGLCVCLVIYFIPYKKEAKDKNVK